MGSTSLWHVIGSDGTLMGTPAWRQLFIQYVAKATDKVTDKVSNPGDIVCQPKVGLQAAHSPFLLL
jgi:hypothetical protein